MLKMEDAQIKAAQEAAREQLKQQQIAFNAMVGEHGGSAAVAEASSVVEVHGKAVFALGFIIGNLTFMPDTFNLKYFVERLWGVGLTGGISYVAGAIERPSAGDTWECQANNSPGTVGTVLTMSFWKNNRPVGVVAGPGLSGGIGMIAGGSGKWS